MAEEDEDTLPRLHHHADTVPKIPDWTPPPAPRRKFGGLRDRLGTIGVVIVVAVILAIIAFVSSFVPAVRHGVSKVMPHQDTVKTPELRDGSVTPTRSPPSHGAVVGSVPGTSRSARPTTSPSRTTSPTRVTTHPVSSPSPTRTEPTPTPTPAQPTPIPTPTPTPTTPTPTPTPTPTDTSTTPAATLSATVTTTST